MYTCSEVAQLIASDEYRSLSLAKRLPVRAHLAMCKYCSRYRRQLYAIAASLLAMLDGLSVPPSNLEAAKNRIVEHLSRKP